MKFAIRLFAVLGWLSFLTAAHAAPILIVNASGQLTGALDVRVQGDLPHYDVSFVDGPCPFAYEECSGSVPLAFTSSGVAVNASQALLELVFENGPQGNFGTEMHVFGCLSTEASCNVITPYDSVGSEFRVIFATARTDNVHDYHAGTIAQTRNTAISGDGLVWAVWVPHVDVPAGAPEPASLALLGIGLFGLGFGRRKKA